MSKRTEFRDMDDHAVVVESRADRKAWAIKFTGVTYREFDKDDAPALALAILEAAGVEVAGFESANYAQIAVGNLRTYVDEMEHCAKEAADREALEGEALKIYAAYHNAVYLNDPPLCLAFEDLDRASKDAAIAMAIVARELHGGTK